VTMPNQEALTWKALTSGKPKNEPGNEINEVLYANVGGVDVFMAWVAMVLGCRVGMWCGFWM
jgi:hypothetical protein